ncbi:hypothetical protein ACFY9N_00445 [Microbacterium sp. NPDC008134]|uniref:hypothetical protein n=1 Tax=Microbacterium sp. NPDC008134 TaxID=3364183 RepID=UPI0036E6AE5D
MAEWNELIIITLAVAFALAVPLITLWRLRTPERRRDEWLGANAQPRFTRIAYALGISLTLFSGLTCTLIALAGYRLAWAPVALCVGLMASTAISARAAFRTPRDLD